MDIQLDTLSITVTEEIKPKYLMKFLRESIKNSDLFIPQDAGFYYYFLKDSLRYEILIFSKNDIYNLDPLLMGGYYEDSTLNTIDLFYTNKYFTIYKDGVLVVYKSVEDVDLNDLIVYAKQVYRLNITNSIKIDQSILDKIRSKKVIKLPIYDLIPNNSYNIFLSFVMMIFLLSSYFIYEQVVYNNNLIAISNSDRLMKEQYEIFQTKYKQNNTLIIKRLDHLFKYLKLNNIEIESIIYVNNKFRTRLIDKNRENLLNFINGYKKKVKVKSIKYYKERSVYMMEVVIDA